MRKKKIVAIIPARMAATRFPGKPLENILGLPLVEHVRRRVSLCNIVNEVYVATCDDEIRNAVEAYDGKVIMTSSAHERCTDRIEEAAQGLEADIIINVQGDEPLILPGPIEALANSMLDNSGILAACLVYPIANEEDLADLNTVKAVLDQQGFIMFFSRSAIPNYRRGRRPLFYEQSGIMAYEKGFLHKYANLPQTPLEQAESVDMLRILEHGYKVKGVVTNNITTEVDLPEHVAAVEDVILTDKAQNRFYKKICNLRTIE